jgi:hypothetical protein
MKVKIDSYSENRYTLKGGKDTFSKKVKIGTKSGYLDQLKIRV